jgi:hypothetical protein
MIKAKATGPDGRQIVVLGLTFADLDKLRAHPLDDHIRINGKEMGLPVDIMIFAGKSEAHCVSILAIDADTKVHIDPRLKS